MKFQWSYSRNVDQTLIIVALLKCVNSEMEGFVVGGDFTRILTYPHSVYLEFHGKNPSVCGGSILNQRMVMTAAHCFDDYKEYGGKVFARYGSENLRETKVISMDTYKMHENYDEYSISNDIAVLRCKTQIKLGRTAKRVSIPRSMPPQKLAFVSGWGAVNGQPAVSQVLKYTEQEMQASRVCKKVGYMPPGTFCAGPLKGSGHPYVGDSGCALVVDKYIQIGIVSFMGSEYSLAVYTNVSYHYSWIIKNVAKTFCAKL